MAENKKIVIGLSGGVDSAVAAYLLQQQGYEVIGVTMQVWHGDGEDNHPVVDQMLRDAERVATQLGIRHYVVNFEEDFRECVAKRFISDYFQGRTPNPCVQCNRAIKWEALLRKAWEYGANYVATGHYAHIEQLSNGRYTISMADYAEKDQTYVLYGLTQEQLAHTIMPLGAYRKEEVRKLAEELGLAVAEKPDSQEICFIPDDDYVSYIEEHREGPLPPKGNFVSVAGEALGQHEGIWHYTVGQRKGLGIALGKPAYVVSIRPETNEVVLGDNEDVFAPALTVSEVNYMGVSELSEPLQGVARIRYAHRGAPCIIYPMGEGRLRVVFDEPQRAITPGQSMVAYADGRILLGGIIDAVENNAHVDEAGDEEV